MSTGESAVMLCGWGVKAEWLVPYVNKRVGGRCDPSFTRANLSALEMSLAHKASYNVLFTYFTLPSATVHR